MNILKITSIPAICAGFLALAAISLPMQASAVTVDENIYNVVKIACGYEYENGTTELVSYGSGVVLDDNLIVTNAHVVSPGDDLPPYSFCLGGVAENSYEVPPPQFFLNILYWVNDGYLDYAFAEAYEYVDEEKVFQDPWTFSSVATYGNPDSLVHGDALSLIGYPEISGGNLTTTQGIVSSYDGPDWIITDASAEFGNSGGGAFDELGNLIGLTSAVVAGELNSLTYVQNINAIMEDAFGTELIQRDYETLYTTDNYVCVTEVGCFNFGEGEILDLEDEEQAFYEEEEEESELISIDEIDAPYEPSMLDPNLQERMKGSILLQVESHGEAWYVNMDDGLRYYMQNGAIAYEMMRFFSLGITDADLEKIPSVEDTTEMLASDSICDTNSLADRLKGNILLQVEQHGEAWYVDPDKCLRIYMEDGAAAYEIMRFLGKGISNFDLTKLPTGIIE